jgi:hypothetical protein
MSDDIKRRPVEPLVAWFYRAVVKTPPDSIAEIAKSVGESEAVIAEGIEEVRGLLAQFDLLDPRLIAVDREYLAMGRKPS